MDLIEMRFVKYDHDPYEQHGCVSFKTEDGDVYILEGKHVHWKMITMNPHSAWISYPIIDAREHWSNLIILANHRVVKFKTDI